MHPVRLSQTLRPGQLMEQGFLAPPIANAVLTYLEVSGFVAEAALMLFGVNVQRWKKLVQER